MFGLVIRRNNNIRVFLQKRFIKDVHHWLFLQNVILKKKHSDVSGGSSAMKSLGCFYCRLSIEIHSSVSMVYLGCIHYKNTQMFFCPAFTWLNNQKHWDVFLSCIMFMSYRQKHPDVFKPELPSSPRSEKTSECFSIRSATMHCV